MASGDTLLTLSPASMIYGASDAAQFAIRNGIPMLVFTKDVTDDAIWAFIMPQHYANTTGVTIHLHTTSPATTPDMDWDFSMSRLTAEDVDGHSFSTPISKDATAGDSTSGIPTIVSQALTKGTQMDSVVKGDLGLLKITRDGADDTDDDLQLLYVEVRET